MTDVTDLTQNPIPSPSLQVLQRNAEDLDRGINGGNTTFQNRAGVTLNSYERALSILGSLNNRGDWVTGTSYASGDLWRHTGTGSFYIVLSGYTSGASESADISLDPAVVQVYQGSSTGLPSGASRPGSVTENGLWIRIVSASQRDVVFYDGSDDIDVFEINPTTNAVTFPTLGSLSLLNSVDDSNWSGDALGVDNGGTGSSTASGARANLGLGSAATLTAGTAANNAVQLDGSGRLPAVSGELLTGISPPTAHLALNTYALLARSSPNTGVTAGSTIAGSSLRTGAVIDGLNFGQATAGGSVVAGTWRLMGANIPTRSGFYGVGLFVRIA